MQKKSWIILAFYIITGLQSTSSLYSQDAIFSQFYANPLYLNPAFAGSQICPRLDLNYRNHPFPDFGHISTYSISYQKHYRPVSGGIGLLATSEQMGETISRHFAGGIYAYQTKLTHRMNLNFGINAAYYRKEIKWNNLVFPDQYDPYTQSINPSREIPPGNTRVHGLDISAGMLLYSENFFAGFASHHLSQPPESFYVDDKLPIKLTLHGGTNLKIDNRRRPLQDFYISPNIILQHQGGFLRTNYGIYFDIEPITTGIWLRQDTNDQKTLIFLLGIYQDDYRVGYSFDYSLPGFYSANTGVHEISVSLNFNCSREKLKYRILNCPNF